MGKGSCQRYEIVFADALQHEEHGGRVAGVGHEMRPLRRHRIGLSRRQPHFFLGMLEEDANGPAHDIEGVMHVVVVMPGHLLLRADLELGNTKPRARRVIGAALHLV